MTKPRCAGEGLIMAVIFREYIAHKGIRAHPDRLYGFGDNHLERKGYGGQARECRGEPNAIGIPTKRAPSMKENAFFSDADYELWAESTKAAWNTLRDAVLEGRTVVFPKAGLGAGLAQLAERAPRIKAAIDGAVGQIEMLGSHVLHLSGEARPHKNIRRSKVFWEHRLMDMTLEPVGCLDATHALTVRQPWTSLIALGFKPYEFRRWPAPKSFVGGRIAIHAARRACDAEEVRAIALHPERTCFGGSAAAAREFAMSILRDGAAVRLGAILGTFTLGEPCRVIEFVSASCVQT